jgi:biofilm PGA synthesis N-glycosyltransferase PgaC
MTTFGYLISLSLVRFFWKRNISKNVTLPKIAVVVPTLNEETLIRDKLINLKKNDYPDESMQIFVIDGGSTDKTIDTVKQEINGKKNTELICLAESKAKPDQINYALQNLDHEIIVFTDADGRLEPSCLKELVTCLVSDSSVLQMPMEGSSPPA